MKKENKFTPLEINPVRNLKLGSSNDGLSLMGLKFLRNIINRNERFLITTHVNPEPDALGSELAFAKLLKDLGKKVKIVNSEKMSERFKFLPKSALVGALGQSDINFDVAVILDCSDLGRIGKVRALLKPHKLIINIDHHISNTKFAKLNIVDTQASSTCEVVYKIFKDFNLNIDKDVATNLYCGILTDTGSFHYSNVTAHTFKIASELVDIGLDVNMLYRKAYEIDSIDSTHLIGGFLKKAKTAFGGKVVYLPISARCNIDEALMKEIAEQALNVLRLVAGAKVFVVLRKSAANSFVRINLRSNCNIDVNRIAAHFNGGGHARAAGATVKGSLSSVRKSLLREIGKRL